MNTTPRLSERTMECATCHNVFSGLTNFDKHRTGDDRKCVHPTTVGLVLNNRGAWGGEPLTAQQRARMGWGATD